MKILYYFWVQFNDTKKRGGGIRIYLENIIKNISINKGVELFSLSGGTSYDHKKYCHIKKIKSAEFQTVNQYEIVNSPMLAPSHFSFFDQDVYLNDNVLLNIFIEFLKEKGPFDIVHFHGFEGLSINVLKIKEKYPGIKIYVSVHNYHCFCPQVNLWKNDQAVCDELFTGKSCLICLPNTVGSGTIRRLYTVLTYCHWALPDFLSSFAKNMHKLYKKKPAHGSIAKTAPGSITESQIDAYSNFRTANVMYINKFADRVFPVSERTGEICAKFHIKSELLHTLYIGTSFSNRQRTDVSFNACADVLRIAYIGYMRKDKGFFFFLESLERFPGDVSARIEVVFAVKVTIPAIKKRIAGLGHKFKKVIFYNGYSHNNLTLVLKQVHLGVVPVLWEDNLPQIAMELKALGIPVLASDRGGASELSESHFFRFKAGDFEDFFSRLKYILDNKSVLDEYWRNQRILPTISEHVNELLKNYEK